MTGVVFVSPCSIASPKLNQTALLISTGFLFASFFLCVNWLSSREKSRKAEEFIELTMKGFVTQASHTTVSQCEGKKTFAVLLRFSIWLKVTIIWKVSVSSYEVLVVNLLKAALQNKPVPETDDQKILILPITTVRVTNEPTYSRRKM